MMHLEHPVSHELKALLPLLLRVESLLGSLPQAKVVIGESFARTTGCVVVRAFRD